MSAYDALDDIDLVDLVRSGNHDAFAQLVRRYTDQFFGLAYRTLRNRAEAEDVVQTAFIKFWERPHLWNADKSLFTTWFYRVVINACHDHTRKASRTVSNPENVIEYSLPSVKSEDVLLQDKQHTMWQKTCLNEGMKRLPGSQRDALNLVVYCALPQKQAAEVMGVSLKALESLLVRAKRSLASTVSSLQRAREMREDNYVKQGK